MGNLVQPEIPVPTRSNPSTWSHKQTLNIIECGAHPYQRKLEKHLVFVYFPLLSCYGSEDGVGAGDFTFLAIVLGRENKVDVSHELGSSAPENVHLTVSHSHGNHKGIKVGIILNESWSLKTRVELEPQHLQGQVHVLPPNTFLGPEFYTLNSEL